MKEDIDTSDIGFAWPGSLRKFRRLVFAGLVKNAGKTTAFNAVNRYFARDALGITSFGFDGEDRDALYDAPKPPVRAYSGQLLLTAAGFLGERREPGVLSGESGRAFEIIESWGDHPQYGPWLIVRCLRDVSLRLAGPSSLPELTRGMKRLEALGAGRIHLDGALGRLTHLSLGSAGVILSTGAALGNSLREVVERTRLVLEYFRLPVTGESGLRSGVSRGAESRVNLLLPESQPRSLGLGGVQDAAEPALPAGVFGSSSAYQEGDRWHNLPGFLWARDLRALLPQDYEQLYLAGALTDRLYLELRKARRLPRTLLLDHPGQILLSAPLWHGLKARSISVRLSRRPNLVCLTLSPWHPRTPIATTELAAALRPHSHVPLVDVARELIWRPGFEPQGNRLI
ncbi:Hypothetical protein DEACI_2073 [Acididesulfobacillus acetoxydans]|uniref:Uncharacterized protein n=1 Tax=Acididesulfobacillus acetoxydans TaxID=1561005 RepID=A0A8S0XX15_9FIRM|nr:hypothetical protein [Acididesulfobacillus acetoxydans]CAA7601407.1 Hypothetical protein DEACI_2073 [Acididesulfobacillus acetoxydans]CEJ08838.1 Hypothetical protein DEACI_3319 [Acididesulfobacillus acetoxydans]